MHYFIIIIFAATNLLFLCFLTKWDNGSPKRWHVLIETEKYVDW